MLIPIPQSVSTVNNAYLALQRFVVLSVALLLLIVCTSCSTVSEWFQTKVSPSPLELTILQVEPALRPGIYTVLGSTTLPEQAQITVSAVRLLEDSQSTNSENAEPTYEILDRQFVIVEQRNWQADLNLWRVASDGTFQEAWQITQQYLTTQFEPLPEVTFTATFDPAQQPSSFQEQIEEEGNLARQTLAQYNSDGELYLQTSRDLTIALPTGSTAPPEVSSSLVKTIRRQVKPEVADTAPSGTVGESATAQSRSDAPLSPREYLR
ncbi:MAG: hypothetical protein ACFE0J_23730 [Elainellaceae cyanobacterium]